MNLRPDEPPNLYLESLEERYHYLTGEWPPEDWDVITLETAIREWGMDL